MVIFDVCTNLQPYSPTPPSWLCEGQRYTIYWDFREPGLSAHMCTCTEALVHLKVGGLSLLWN